MALAVSVGCAAGGSEDAGAVDPDVGVEEDTGEVDKDTGEPEDVVLPSFDIPVDRGNPSDVVASPDVPTVMDVATDVRVDAGTVEAGGPHDVGCTAICNGSCANTAVDPLNCGACGRDCTAFPGVNPAGVTCVRGACVFGTAGCVAGRGDCDGNPTNGCEALLNTTTRCGSCVAACSGSTPLCAMVPTAPSGYACTSGCTAPASSRCGSTCVDLTSSPLNCGACGTVCPAGTGGTAACVGGACRLNCTAGRGDCDGAAANGCEVQLTTSALHCGACGNVCSGGANATAACSAGACSLTCAAGFGNCDGMLANGCETDTRTTLTSCGACGAMCPARANATATCAAGACGIACSPNFGNCDLLPANGCEVDLRTNATSCGMCGRRCAIQANAAATCTDGVCGISCSAGFGDCDGIGTNGCEAPFAMDASNCGACGTRCPGGDNATPTCAASRCGLTCATGFGDCDATAANGCETATTTSMAHCGACGRACNAPPNSTAACVASVCVVTCEAGYTLSAGTCVRTPPRPVSPAGFSFATSTTPTFRVALPPGQTGAFVEVCRDRNCTSVATTMTFTGSSGTLTTPLLTTPTGMYFWRASGRVGSTTATTAGTPTVFYVAAARRPGINAAWGSVLDANADGSPEMLVGAPGTNQVSLYPGTATGFAAVTLRSGGTGYGTSVAALGDIDGDGYADAAVGEPGTNRVYVYRGASTGLSTASTVLPAPSTVMGFGAAVAGAGDVNGDGFSDLLVGAPTSNRTYLYFGSATGIPATSVGTLVTPTGSPSNYGASAAGIGDINADGFADVAVGTNGANNVYVFLGSATGLGTSTLVNAGASGFGFAVAAAGDVTNDGYPDMIVGAYSAQVAYVFAGGASGITTTPAATLAVAANGVLFGWSVDGLGDVNGDTFSDVLVGAPGSERAYLFQGGPAGIVAIPTQTYQPTAGSTATLLGRAVAHLGDVNRDGVYDFAVGQPGRYTVQTFRGAATPVLWQTFSSGTTSQFGSAFAR